MLGIFIALFLVLFNGAWLWFCYVYVTKDHRRPWMEMVVWTFGAGLPAYLLIFAVEEFPGDLLKIAVYTGGYLAKYGILYAVLAMRYDVEKMADKGKILVAHFVGTFIVRSIIQSVI